MESPRVETASKVKSAAHLSRMSRGNSTLDNQLLRWKFVRRLFRWPLIGPNTGKYRYVNWENYFTQKLHLNLRITQEYIQSVYCKVLWCWLHLHWITGLLNGRVCSLETSVTLGFWNASDPKHGQTRELPLQTDWNLKQQKEKCVRKDVIDFQRSFFQFYF